MIWLAIAAGVGAGVLLGFLVTIYLVEKLLPQIVSHLTFSLVNPGNEEIVAQPENQANLSDLLKDLSSQLEPEPLPKDLDWMEDVSPS
jgi:ABC-type uncharacterized transport system permease subunit